MALVLVAALIAVRTNMGDTTLSRRSARVAEGRKCCRSRLPFEQRQHFDVLGVREQVAQLHRAHAIVAGEELQVALQ
jgi:hypothetical protein